MNLYTKIDDAFEAFKASSASDRKAQIPKLQGICREIESATNNDSYVGSKCVSFIEVCRHMARLRQSKSYDEFSEISNALGDLNIMRQYLESA
jgi:hypothetical protein